MKLYAEKVKLWWVAALAGALICFPAQLVHATALSVEKPALGTLFPADMGNNEGYPAMVYFKRLLQKKSGGHYEVEIFPGGQLGSEVEMTREVRDGTTLQMVLTSSGAFSSFYKKYQAIIQPYLFPDKLTAWTFFDSQYFADFMGELPKIGLRYLGTMDDGGGFVVLTNSLRPVYTPKDFDGMRVRTEENPAHMAVMNGMGASAVPMAWGQVQTSLATKVAHAQFNAPSIIVWTMLWETQKYVTYLNHIYNSLTWVVSDKWFQAQSPEHQKIILTSARSAIIYSRGVAAHLSDLAEDEAKKHGMKFNRITPENMQKFKKLGMAGYRKWAVEEFGLKAELLDEVRNEVAKAGERIANQLVKEYTK